MENIIILISLGASDLTMISGTNEVTGPRVSSGIFLVITSKV
jgi:hypothetical protein